MIKSIKKTTDWTTFPHVSRSWVTWEVWSFLLNDTCMQRLETTCLIEAVFEGRLCRLKPSNSRVWAVVAYYLASQTVCHNFWVHLRRTCGFPSQNVSHSLLGQGGGGSYPLDYFSVTALVSYIVLYQIYEKYGNIATFTEFRTRRRFCFKNTLRDKPFRTSPDRLSYSLIHLF